MTGPAAKQAPAGDHAHAHGHAAEDPKPKFEGKKKKKKKTTKAAAAASSTAVADEAAAPAFEAGAVVEARFDGGDEWFPGRVAAANADGTYAIAYDDGDEEAAVAGGLVRRLAAGGES